MFRKSAWSVAWHAAPRAGFDPVPDCTQVARKLHAKGPAFALVKREGSILHNHLRSKSLSVDSAIISAIILYVTG